MDMDRESDEQDDEDVWESPIRVEIVEQPPIRCVYRRNLRPFPEVRLVGIDSKNPQLQVAVLLVRCDTMAVLEDSLSGDVLQRAASGSTIQFKRLKVLQTSHQLGDTHFALRFELRDYSNGQDNPIVLHTLQSIPFMVLSHSTQLNKPQSLLPVVTDIIPQQGFVRGGTRIVVLGENFMDSPGLRVRFDQTEVQPSYHGPRTLICVTPPSRRGVGPVSIRVCNDGRKWGNEGDVPFGYVGEEDPASKQSNNKKNNAEDTDVSTGVQRPGPLPVIEETPVQPLRQSVNFFELGGSNDNIPRMSWPNDGFGMAFMLTQNLRGGSLSNMDISQMDLSSSK